MRKFIFLLMLLAILNFYGQTSSAEIKTFHAESSYIMNRGEPIKDAQEKAFNDTVRLISEEAGVIIKSFSSTKNSSLTADEIETITAAVLRIKTKNFNKKFTADGDLEVSANVDAEVDSENVEKLLSELSAAHNVKNYDEFLADYMRRQKQFDTVYGDYLSSYQKRIKRKIRDGCKLQNVGKLDEALKFYNEAIIESVVNNSELSVAYIKRGHIYNIRGKKNFATADFEKAITLNNDTAGVHYAKAVLLESRGDKIQAAQEYRIFVKDASIVYYDMEITDALNKIIELEEVH